MIRWHQNEYRIFREKVNNQIQNAHYDRDLDILEQCAIQDIQSASEEGEKLYILLQFKIHIQHQMEEGGTLYCVAYSQHIVSIRRGGLILYIVLHVVEQTAARHSRESGYLLDESACSRQCKHQVNTNSMEALHRGGCRTYKQTR